MHDIAFGVDGSFLGETDVQVCQSFRRVPFTLLRPSTDLGHEYRHLNTFTQSSLSRLPWSKWSIL